MNDRPDLKVIGEIKPPEYKDPVKMLRNIADDIEGGEFGEVTCVALVTFGDDGLNIFGGGQEESGPVISMMMLSAANKIANTLLD